MNTFASPTPWTRAGRRHNRHKPPRGEQHDVTDDRTDEPAEIERTVAEIKTASALVVIIIALGWAWSIVVAASGWGILIWAPGAAVWCLLLYRAVRALQELRCPRCGRAWRQPLSEVPQREWPIQRRCSGCGFRLDDYSIFPPRMD